MKIYVPYTDLREETAKSIQATGHLATYVDVSSRDDAYYELLQDAWKQQKSFVIVEHDVVIHPTAIDELVECKFSWCAFPTQYYNGEHVGLGCVKFGELLLRRFPKAMDQVAKMHDPKHPPKHWCRLDAWLTRVLPTSEMHVHKPTLRHLRETEFIHPAHGCV